MNIWYSLFLTLILFGLGFLGVKNPMVFGVIIPYAALAIFVIGIIYRVVKWAKSPVPFRWPTTSGQQKSLSWIKSNNLESPHNIWGVLGRMFLEILFFRSLFRNTKAELREGPNITYASNKYLWVGAMIFHWSFLIIFIRHFRFFTEPVISLVHWLQSLDGLFEFYLAIDRTIPIPIFLDRSKSTLQFRREMRNINFRNSHHQIDITVIT